MFRSKQKTQFKELEDFELRAINLIAGLPIDYAYVMRKSIRVIQKANREALMDIIKESPDSIEYIKLGPDKDFQLIDTIPELKASINHTKRTTAKQALKLWGVNFVIITAIIMIAHFYFDSKYAYHLFGLLLYSIISGIKPVYWLIKYKAK